MSVKARLVSLFLVALSTASLATSCQQATLPPPTETLAPPNTPVPATPTLAPSPTPAPLVQQLTFLVGPTNQPTGQSIYAVTIGCLDQSKPCLGQPELLLQLDMPVYAFSWSPDGKHIAYAASTDQAHSDIYVSDWDGKDRINITHSTAKANFPAWSPDGKSIAFESCDQQGCSLATANPDGSGLDKLLQQSLPALGLHSPRLVRWAPNGQEITFVADSNKSDYEQVFVSDPDGIAIKAVTNENTHHLSPSFSHTGDWIAFVREYEEGLIDRSDIVIEHPDGSGVNKLTNSTAARPLDTAWAPFDDWLAFSSIGQDASAATYDVYLIRADGAGLTNVTATAGRSEWAPAWRIVK